MSTPGTISTRQVCTLSFCCIKHFHLSLSLVRFIKYVYGSPGTYQCVLKILSRYRMIFFLKEASSFTSEIAENFLDIKWIVKSSIFAFQALWNNKTCTHLKTIVKAIWHIFAHVSYSFFLFFLSSFISFSFFIFWIHIRKCFVFKAEINTHVWICNRCLWRNFVTEGCHHHGS